jgi:hypothetical protein
MSYFKRAHTFRTAVGNTPAARARLRSPSLVGFYIPSPVPAGFVAELIAERRPSCIEYGFSHPRLYKFGGAHIADNDKPILANYRSSRLVVLILSDVRNLCVDGFDATLVAGALLNGERDLVLAIVLKRRNSVAIAARRQRPQSKVDPYLSVAGRQVIGNLTLETDIPAPASVLSKAAGLDVVGNIPRFPEVEFPFEVDDMCAFETYSALDKWQPTECALRPTAGAKARGVAGGVARDYKLLANLTDRIGVQPKFRSTSSSQLDKIEVRRPTTLRRAVPVIGHRPALYLATVIPHEVARPRVPPEVLTDHCVFDAELICKDHTQEVLVGGQKCKASGANDIAFPGSRSTWSASRNTDAKSSMAGRLTGSRRTLPRFARQWIVYFSPATVRTTMSICWSSTHRNTRSLSWLMPSRVRPAGYCAPKGQTSPSATGRVFCGPRPILPPRPAEPRLKRLSGTSNSSAPPPRPEGQGFRLGDLR